MPRLSGPDLRLVRQEAVVVLGWFVATGVVCGLLWWQLTPLATWVVDAQKGSMDEVQLSRVVAVDGWFAAISCVAGLASGIVLAAWRKADPLLTVGLVTAGAAIASALMYFLGHALGPGDVEAALARAGVGERVPIRLEPEARAVYLVLPITALIGALGVFWGIHDHDGDVQPESTSHPAANG